MDNTQYKGVYIAQLEKLKEIIEIANSRIVSEEPDDFFQNNTNFFTKSFLVIMCAYLESYLKDALMVIIDETNNKLNLSKLPHNLVRWSLNIEKEFKNSDSKFEDFKIPIKKKELDDFISGNPFRTKDLFKKLGINLDCDLIFESQKERINAIVVKRNKVIHHNDDASDVSNDDLLLNINIITEYISNIDRLICSHI
ncbi:hypothetical protein ACM46_16975 [Chryseobacterium angstadtii]|uniref:RiboL-PSP-HEPN domain-containing protein n=1 Tax=Chryseobacterium angstadtii TaxID=558151 RepID=A0A0J7I2A2_9FLAO|nr:HEPN domain-containing protein [Chryseobacterium angstadtii]KMQ59951.1 hypothetical protein ACM46_16975 [Chryseobacterium angstadtii]